MKWRDTSVDGMGYDTSPVVGRDETSPTNERMHPTGNEGHPPPVKLVGPVLERQAECEAILRTLPEWFGIEDALQRYACNTGLLPTFAIEESSELVGFISLREHFPESWEIECVAVRAGRRNCGLGSQLLGHAENWVAGRGGVYLQVKTLAPGAGDPNYEQTREFYLRHGYTPIEVFPNLWSPSNPALLMVKRLV